MVGVGRIRPAAESLFNRRDSEEFSESDELGRIEEGTQNRFGPSGLTLVMPTKAARGDVSDPSIKILEEDNVFDGSAAATPPKG